ncbi:MAG: Ig-like domain-containing protein [Lachnospiraceae bacterium]|nr:Ig-like domain-containing protein [Lachnospiraceae bacterium]
MRNMKRWIAAMLTIVMTVSDCGVIPAFAAEDAVAVENAVAENNAFSGEMSADSEYFSESEIKENEKEEGLYEKSNEEQNKDATGSMQDEIAEVTDSELDTETKLPALHIGQIKKGEKLPDPNDSNFVYDLPISFAAVDCLVLFANYDINTIPDQKENGTLRWNILRGEKGMAAGSASLMNEEDDWTNYEVVSDSPYFIMTENEDKESDYYKMIELASEEDAEQDDYDYYIRVAYYLGTGEDKDEDFYAAATVPFLFQNDIADIDQAQEDTIDIEENDIDKITDDMTDTKDIDQEENGDDTLTEDSDAAETPEGIDHENSELDKITDNIISVSENDIAVEDFVLSDSDMVQPEAEEHISEIILDKTDITMQPGDTEQLTATTAPENIQAKISWESSNEAVAAVNETGEIKARAEGITYITAECDGLTAVGKVEVAPSDTNDKLLDLSGDIWVAGFKRESEDFVYSGQKITQDIRVYYKDILLTEKTDYTLSYKNNIDAAVYNTAKAPSVTINLKGQYSGSVTLYYTIRPLNINDIDIYNTDKEAADETGTEVDHSPGYEQTVNYSKILKIPSPVLTFGKKKLAVNKDFICDYTLLSEKLAEESGQSMDYRKGDSYKPGQIYNYIVNGIGNFAGSFQMQLVILKDKNLNFSSASVKLGQKQYEYHGTALSKSDITIDELKLGGQILGETLYEYEVSANGIEGAYVTIYPSEAGRAAGYRGSKNVNLKLVGDRNIGDAALGEQWKGSIPFSQKIVNKYGGIFQEKAGLLTYGAGEMKETLTEGKDYTIKYSNAKKVGKVTVTFTGKGRYKGTLKQKYEITPNNDEKNLTIVWGKNVTDKGGIPEVTYQKGGAVPDFVIKDQDRNVLKNKTDYTVKVKDNKNPGTIMSCEITGNGNYKGYTKNVQLQVTAGDISKAIISIPDKPYSTKRDAWKSIVAIKDVNGKKLVAGTDYVKEFTFKYEDMESGQPPQKNTTVKVTVQGMGCYEGSFGEGSYRIFENNISKLKIVIDPQEYTGEEITLSSSDIHVYTNSTDAKNKRNELGNGCYEIVEYKNNIKAGTAKVTLRGRGDYGGTKTYSFKIQRKAYRINHVKSITLDKTSLSLRLAEKEVQLTATITPEDSWEKIANPTVIWSTSNGNIATVEIPVESSGVDGDRAVTRTVKFKNEGTVTITATAQDGNKKAQCKITIVDVPILKEAGQKIEGKVGDTYQLTVEWEESQAADPNKLKWESNNEDRVAVDKNGLVTMKKIGAATITLRVGSSRYVQQCNVIVKGEEEEVLPEGRALIYEQKPDTVDDAIAINELLRNWEWNPGLCDYLYIPAGVYRIGATISDDNGFGGIVLTDNQKLIMSPSALLVAIGNNSSHYRIIYAFDRDNVTISGGQIIGDRDIHTGKGGEAGHGIQIDGCKNVYISDVEVSKCWGDGIYLGAYSSSAKPSCDGVTIENCNLHHNRRSNLSITDANNVMIDNCQFNYASGTDPQYGIDIEHNYRTTKHVKITNSTFKGNAKASMGIIKSADDIRLENCTLDGAFYNMAGTNVVLKNTTIKGEIVDATGGIKRE